MPGNKAIVLDIDQNVTAGGLPRRLFFYNAGFLRQPRLRRILALAGHDLRLGWPEAADGVVVWGRSPYAARGEAVAARAGVPLIRVEDAFLRSIRPGRMGDAPLGLLIDRRGVHFDSAAPSDLEHLLASHPLDDAALLSRAKDGMARLQALDLSKYNLHRSDLAPPPPGYVLVIDQTRGDASIRHAGANAATFARMLAAARTAHPGVRIVIKSHPETQMGLRPGHFTAADTTDGASLLTDPVSPWRLLTGAIAVYAVSSQLGFEAILTGHRPHVFGQPFYAGWCLTADAAPLPRRSRRLTATQLFAAAMILAPTWYDPCRDRLCRFEEAIDQLEAETRAFRQDRAGHVATKMRLWKRGRLQAVFGEQKPLLFHDDPAKASAKAAQLGRSVLIWASQDRPGLFPPNQPVLRIEDGFLRSRGLGANLVPPLSLVADDLGIYYDPSRPSRLEALMVAPLPPGGARRAEALIAAIVAARVSKYNLAATAQLDLPPGFRLLVPGQVEDDASIRLGAGAVRSNLALLHAARAAHPDAVLVYKPHPDVEAGLRPGAIAAADLAGLADVVARQADPLALIDACDAVWTMTSTLGFEALLRGKPVTCLGAPFYAGWGLTNDLAPVPQRRQLDPAAAPNLLHLAHAALIAYPRYFDPISRRPCPPEVAIDRLASGDFPRPGLALRLMSKAQGAFASRARLWR